MKAIGILAGIGTLLREAQEAGMDVQGNFETRAPFRITRSVWDWNFPGAALYTLPNAVGIFMNEADIALGHPPCGSHSVLGVAHSLDLPPEVRAAMVEARGKRMGLLPQFVEHVRLLKPKCFALDNLPKILKTVATPEWWQAALPEYRMTFIIMKNWDYGTPQIRQRLWIIGMRRPYPRFRFTEPRTRLQGPKTAWDAVKDLPWEPWIDDVNLAHVHLPPDGKPFGSYPTLSQPPEYVDDNVRLAHGYLSLPPMACWPYRTRTTDRITKKLGRVRLKIDAHSRVISGGTLQHPITGWTMTARERARLMDWPDDFWLGDTSTMYDRSYQARLTLFTGKAVPSRFPRYLIPQLMKHLRRG